MSIKKLSKKQKKSLEDLRKFFKRSDICKRCETPFGYDFKEDNKLCPNCRHLTRKEKK